MIHSISRICFKTLLFLAVILIISCSGKDYSFNRSVTNFGQAWKFKKQDKDVDIKFYTGEIDDTNWENVSLKVTSNSLMTSNEWLESLILDLFAFKPDEIIKWWDLNEYDFSEEIISHFNIWKVKDKVGEMILV